MVKYLCNTEQIASIIINTMEYYLFYKWKYKSNTTIQKSVRFFIVF